MDDDARGWCDTVIGGARMPAGWKVVRALGSREVTLSDCWRGFLARRPDFCYPHVRVGWANYVGGCNGHSLPNAEETEIPTAG